MEYDWLSFVDHVTVSTPLDHYHKSIITIAILRSRIQAVHTDSGKPEVCLRVPSILHNAKGYTNLFPTPPHRKPT